MEGRGWVHVPPVCRSGCTHTGGHGHPARPKYRAWTRAEVWAPLVERGLHLLSSRELTKLQRIFVSCSWRLRSAPTGSPRPRLQDLLAPRSRGHGHQDQGSQRATCLRPGRPRGEVAEVLRP